MLEAGLVSLLSADAGVTALVAARIFPIVLPENMDVNCVGPCLTYQDITGSSTFTTDKKQSATKRIQFDSFSKNYQSAKQVLMAVSKVLDGYVGTLPDGTRVIFANSSVETDNFENDGRVFRCLSEYEIDFVAAP
jgi:hypothetical protein